MTKRWCGHIFLGISLMMAVHTMHSTVAMAAERGFLGMQVQGISSKISGALGLEKVAGVLVRDVSLDGPAANAGVRRGDLIVGFGGVEIDTFDRLLQTTAKFAAGDTIKLDLVREGERRTIDLTLSGWPDGWRVAQSSFAAQPELGITVAALTPKLRDRMGIRWGSTGVVVTVSDDQFAGTTPLRRGDIIVQINQRDIWDPKAFIDAYAEAKAASRPSLLILVERTDGFKYLLQPIVYAAPGGGNAPLFQIPGQSQ